MYIKTRVGVQAYMLLSLPRFPRKKLLALGVTSPCNLRHSPDLRFRLLATRPEAMTEDKRMVLGAAAPVV